MIGVCKEEYKPNRASISKLDREKIVCERLWLLEKLKDKVDGGDLKAIEIYNKILSEIRDDLESIEEFEVELEKVLAELIEDEA